MLPLTVIAHLMLVGRLRFGIYDSCFNLLRTQGNFASKLSNQVGGSKIGSTSPVEY